MRKCAEELFTAAKTAVEIDLGKTGKTTLPDVVAQRALSLGLGLRQLAQGKPMPQLLQDIVDLRISASSGEIE